MTPSSIAPLLSNLSTNLKTEENYLKNDNLSEIFDKLLQTKNKCKTP